MDASQQQQRGEDQAQQVADQAREKVGEAKDQAKNTAQKVASQTQDRIREQVGQRSTEVGERVGSTAQDIRSVGEELRNQGKETPAKIAEEAAHRIDRAGSYLRDSDADRLLNDVEDFGRRQPWAVLAGAVVVGIAAARFLKASSRERNSSPQGRQYPPDGSNRQLDPTPTPVTDVAPSTAATPQATPVEVG